MTSRWQRAPFVRIYEHRDEVHILGDDGTLRSFGGDSGSLVRVLLEVLQVPCTHDQLMARVGERTGSTEGLGVVEEALDIFKGAGVVHKVSTGPGKIEASGQCPGRIALALAGGIAAAYAPALVELLSSRGFSVRVVATKSALHFVSALALEALTHKRVVSKVWPKDPRNPVPHLELSRWADVVVVYPATATTLSRIARGDCSTVVSALAVSSRSPVVLVPAMNHTMFDAPAVQRNLSQLRDDGFWITHPCFGYEAANRPADRSATFGAALPVQLLVGVIEAILSSQPRAQ